MLLPHLFKNRWIYQALGWTLLPLLSFAQTGNYYAGKDAGKLNTGSNNTFVGSEAGPANTTGGSNVFLGRQTGFSNSKGSANVFIGYKVGYTNSTGMGNTFVGDHSGYYNSTGNYNNFLGDYAGFFNSNGSYNTFQGGFAGLTNTTGTGNTFLGYETGYNNTDGFYNTFLGYQTGYSNLTGADNTFIGGQAGQRNTTGYGNAFVGNESGYSNTSGFYNSFLGYRAGNSNTTGAGNTFFGNQAGKANTTASRNTAIGSFAGEKTTTGLDNTFLGRSAGEKNTTGTGNTAVGNYAGSNSGNLSNATAIGFRAQVTAANSLVLGSINGVNGATADVNVGIGVTAPTYQLQLSKNSAAKPGSSSWTVASDERLKKDITSFQDGLAVLKKVNPVWFKYTGEAGMPTDKAYVGILAQQMQKAAPYTISTFTHQDSTGQQQEYLNYDANALTYILVNAVKELEDKHQKALQAKEAQMAALAERLANLEERLEGYRHTDSSKKAAGQEVSTVGAQIWQNEPNPTDGRTVIPYFIPDGTRIAQIKLFTLSGSQLQNVLITERGSARLTLNTESLPTGTYVYYLMVDGQLVGSKKLVIVH